MAGVAPAVLSAHLDGEAVLLHMDSKRYYRLNSTGQRIWRMLEQKLDRAAIVNTLVAEFDVTPTQAEADLNALVAALQQHTLLTPAVEDV